MIEHESVSLNTLSYLINTGSNVCFSFVNSPTPEEIAEPDSTSEVQPAPKKGFLTATIEELKLVVWPSRQQLLSESIAVILIVILSAAFIAVVSRFYAWGASQIFL